MCGIPDPSGSLEGWVREAGFVDVVVRRYKTPWGTWPKDKKMRDIGNIVMINGETAFEAYGLALMTRYGGMSEKETRELCEAARKELFGGKVHVYNYQ